MLSAVRTTALIVIAVLFGGLVVVAPEVPAGAAPMVPAESAGPPDGPAPLAFHPQRRPQARSAPAQQSEAAPTRAQKTPSAAALDNARSYARSRGGAASFAAVNSKSQLRGYDDQRRYASASVVKAMLLAAELRRLKQAGDPIDPQTDALLRAMITYSDNEAADAIYSRVGDDGLEGVARRAGMRRFTVAGYWGNAQIAAGDMALMFGDLARVLVSEHREYALGLLGSIVPEQSWGIPEAAGGRWAARFKGGWLPDRALVHQVAELRERAGDRRLSVAILTDEQPSHEYAVETVRGIAERLLAPR